MTDSGGQTGTGSPNTEGVPTGGVPRPARQKRQRTDAAGDVNKRCVWQRTRRCILEALPRASRETDAPGRSTRFGYGGGGEHGKTLGKRSEKKVSGGDGEQAGQGPRSQSVRFPDATKRAVYRRHCNSPFSFLFFFFSGSW